MLVGNCGWHAGILVRVGGEMKLHSLKRTDTYTFPSASFHTLLNIGGFDRIIQIVVNEQI